MATLEPLSCTGIGLLIMFQLVNKNIANTTYQHGTKNLLAFMRPLLVFLEAPQLHIVITCNRSLARFYTQPICRRRRFLVTFTYMSEITYNYYRQFFTATISEWRYLVIMDSMKQIIISRLQYL